MNLIIVPVRNESKTIRKTAKDIFSYGQTELEEYKIVFIDDKSTDDTVQEILKSKIDNRMIMRNRFDGGKGSALKTAYILVNSQIKLKAEDNIIFLDGDGQINPREITTFLKLMSLYDADIVIGNKRHKYSITLYGLMRKFISKTYNILIQILFGLNFEDTQCGLKIFKKRALDKVIEQVNIKRYAFDLEILIACRENGFRVIDAPVYIERKMNKGSVSFKSIIKTFFDTLTIWYKKNKGYYV